MQADATSESFWAADPTRAITTDTRDVSLREQRQKIVQAASDKNMATGKDAKAKGAGKGAKGGGKRDLQRSQQFPKKRKLISKVMADDGSMKTDPQEVADVFADFTNLFIGQAPTHKTGGTTTLVLAYHLSPETKLVVCCKS